jgi:hypothetical protein
MCNERRARLIHSHGSFGGSRLRFINDLSFANGGADHQTMRVAITLDFLRSRYDGIDTYRSGQVAVNRGRDAMPIELTPLTTSKSRSLSGPVVPRATDPNSTIFSGSAASTTRFTTSARIAGSGLPVLFFALVFMAISLLYLGHLCPWLKFIKAHRWSWATFDDCGEGRRAENELRPVDRREMGGCLWQNFIWATCVVASVYFQMICDIWPR